MEEYITYFLKMLKPPIKVFFYNFGGEIMELKDTVQLMQSNDYKDRFRARVSTACNQV